MAPPSPPAATVADGRSNAPGTLFFSPRAFERARTNRTRRPIGHGVYIQPGGKPIGNDFLDLFS